MNDLSNLPPRSKITAGLASCACTAAAVAISAATEARVFANVIVNLHEWPRDFARPRRAAGPIVATGRKDGSVKAYRPEPVNRFLAGPPSARRSTSASTGGAAARR